jgi:hypothetical protein
MEGGTGMIPEHVRVQGVLKSDGTLELDESPQMAPGRVRVELTREISSDPEAADSVWSVLEGIRKKREAEGVPRRTAEEIDAEINALRNEFEDRLEEIDRMREGFRKRAE